MEFVLIKEPVVDLAEGSGKQYYREIEKYMPLTLVTGSSSGAAF